MISAGAYYHDPCVRPGNRRPFSLHPKRRFFSFWRTVHAADAAHERVHSLGRVHIRHTSGGERRSCHLHCGAPPGGAE
eukprot:5925388-Pyramimonas_sp.AAC.2